MSAPWEKYQTEGPWAKYEGVSVPEDVARSALTTAVKGVPDLVDVAASGVATVIDKGLGVSNKGWGDTFNQYVEQRPVSLGVDAVLGTKEYVPQTDAGRYTAMGVRGAVTAPLFGGATMMNVARGFTGGLASEAGGDIGQQVGGDTGRLVGNVAGGVVGASLPDVGNAVAGPLMARAKAAFGKAVAPTIDEGTAKLAMRAQELGVPMSVTQVAPSRVRNTIQKVSQAAPASGVQAFEDGQRAAWNKALSRTIGLDTDSLTPEAVNTFLKNIDDSYSNALKSTTVRIGKGQLNKLDEIAQDAAMAMGSDGSQTVAKNIQYIRDELKNGFVRGEKANNLRKTIMRRASKASPEVREYLGELATTLNEVIEQGVPEANKRLLGIANKQYRNFKTLEPLLEKSVDGDINPTSLLQRVASSKYIKGSRTEVGSDDLVDLARIGKMMPKLGGSDTVEKLAYGSAAYGAGGAAAVFDPVTTGVVVAGNRAYQSLYNQSQNVLNGTIGKSLPKGVTKNTVEKVGASLNSGNLEDIVKAAGSVETARAVVNLLGQDGDRDARKEAFELSKELNEMKVR
jgi:hypothetical protein